MEYVVKGSRPDVDVAFLSPDGTLADRFDLRLPWRVTKLFRPRSRVGLVISSRGPHLKRSRPKSTLFEMSDDSNPVGVRSPPPPPPPSSVEQADSSSDSEPGSP